MIDPGHGGYDHGAVYGKAKESQIVLQISSELKKQLEADGYKVSLTRASNVPVSLEQRVQKSEKEGADLYVSLHANAVQDARVEGVEYFFELPRLPKSNSTLSKKTEVEDILLDLKNQFRQRRSLSLSESFNEQVPGRIKQAPFYVLSKNQIPAVLVEVGFLSNNQESKKLQNLSFQKEIAEKMSKAIQSFEQQRKSTR